MPHVVLLGDSIFDNAAYVAGGPDVAAQLRAALPGGWSVTLAAVDGSVVADVHRQIARLPREATHLVLSVGGNDALGHVDILERRAGSVAEVLDLLAGIRAEFERGYHELLERLGRPGLPVWVCTIYNGWFPEPALRRRTSTALTVFNDAILRAALLAGCSAIELRLVCTAAVDYANPIEPSVQGGARVARAIAGALTRPDALHHRSEVVA